MGFRFRRSTKIGPFRVTASKKGLGMSAGAGPFRISRSATGRVTRTVRVPGTGISYVSSTGSSKGRGRGAGRGRAPARPARGGSAFAPQAPSVRPKLQVPDEQWRQLLTPDGTAAALPFQRDYVRAAVHTATGIRPSLLHLTVGQAEGILLAVGADLGPLTRGGRDSEQLNRCGTWAKWALLAVLLLVVTFSSPGGFIVAAGIILWVVIARKRRQRRQEWEDQMWGKPGPTPAQD